MSSVTGPGKAGMKPYDLLAGVEGVEPGETLCGRPRESRRAVAVVELEA